MGKGGVFRGFQGVHAPPNSFVGQQIALQQQQAAAKAAADAAAAEQLKAQQQKEYQGRLAGAENAATAGSQQAQAQLNSTNQARQSIDESEIQAASTGGGSGIGSGYNLAGAKSAALAGLGVGGGSGAGMAQSAQNTVAQTPNTNSAQQAARASSNLTGNSANQFTMPQTSGIIFGGS
jgi:hypothetical protein